jgi:hypothetical protein
VNLLGLAQGDQFFSVSYAIQNEGSDAWCYYLAIIDSLADSLSCHSLIPYDYNSKIVNLEMNPLGGDGILAFGADNSLYNISVEDPVLSIESLLESGEFNLTIGSQTQLVRIIVNPPNDTLIYQGWFSHSINRNGENATLAL